MGSGGGIGILRGKKKTYDSGFLLFCPLGGGGVGWYDFVALSFLRVG